MSYSTQNDLELPILQPVPPDRWDDRYMPVCMGAEISNLALCMPGGQALYCSELGPRLQPHLGTVGIQKEGDLCAFLTQIGFLPFYPSHILPASPIFKKKRNKWCLSQKHFVKW